VRGALIRQIKRIGRVTAGLPIKVLFASLRIGALAAIVPEVFDFQRFVCWHHARHQGVHARGHSWALLRAISCTLCLCTDSSVTPQCLGNHGCVLLVFRRQGCCQARNFSVCSRAFQTVAHKLSVISVKFQLHHGGGWQLPFGFRYKLVPASTCVGL